MLGCQSSAPPAIRFLASKCEVECKSNRAVGQKQHLSFANTFSLFLSFTFNSQDRHTHEHTKSFASDLLAHQRGGSRRHPLIILHSNKEVSSYSQLVKGARKMDNNNNKEQEEAEAFNAALDPFVADVTSLDVINIKDGSKSEVGELSGALAWFREAIYYNLPHGKRNRGLAVVMTHKILAEHYEQVPDLERARMLGWCIEMLQTHFLILDDIMDESLTRRGQKCWHLKKNVGHIAINDSSFMQQTIFYILRKHFIDSPYFKDLLKLLFDTMMITTVGQCLDLKSSAKPGEIPDLDIFTINKYNAIVDYKTAFYSFSAPIRLGMILSGLLDPCIHSQADVILRRMGQFFQVQDDYLDCFGDPMVMGKIGTDIEEGKCCWPIVTALSIANEKQRAILEQNYARKDKQNTEAVKRVYRELNIEAIYKQFEMDSVLELKGLIDKFSKDTQIPGDIFYSMLLKICGRQK